MKEDGGMANFSSKIGRNREAKRQSNDRYGECSSSNTYDDKGISSKIFRKYGYYAQYLVENLSKASSSDTDSTSTDGNDSDIERPVGHESPETIILLDTDEETNETAAHTNENCGPTRTMPTTTTTTTTTTITTPIRTTPTRNSSSPAHIENDHHIRFISNIKKEKRHRSPKPYRKNHRTVPLHMLQNERETSPSSDDDEYASTTDESDEPANHTPNNSYAKAAPTVFRRYRRQNRRDALSFVVTAVPEPPQPMQPMRETVTNVSDAPTTPDLVQPPMTSASSSPKHQPNHNPPHSMMSYSSPPPQHSPQCELHDDEDAWSNLSDNDNFSDFHDDEANDMVTHHEVEVEVEQEEEEEELDDSESLDDDFKPEADDEFVRNGAGRADFEAYRGVTIDFDDRPQIVEINMPASHTDDPHQLVVESEETIEYAEAQSLNIYPKFFGYRVDTDETTDSESTIGTKFPIKVVESDATNALTIADIILRMSQQEIDTDDAIVATTTKGIEPDDVSEHSDGVNVHGARMAVPNDIHRPIDTASQFLNASNARQVLVLLKTRIYFHGSLSIRLIAGNASIFGYALTQGETVFAYSPRSDNCLCMAPTESDHHHQNNVEISLNDLPNAFAHSDLERMVDDFDGSRDAIVLLENDSSNRSINMVENYMGDTMCTNIEPSIGYRHRQPHHLQSSEAALRCRLFTHTDDGLRVNSQWNDVHMTVNSRQMVIGGKGVGKSTFLRYSINKNLQEFDRILLIDLDIGLPEMFVPQTVSATIITEPILGPGYIRNASPYKAYLFGDVDVLVSPIKYLKSVLKLLKYCSCRDELRSMPWVINTMGYSHGIGLELIAAILRALNPTDLIQIESPKSADNVDTILSADVVNAFGFNIFRNEVQSMQNECTYATYVCKTMASARQQDDWDKSQRDLQYAMLIAKFGSTIQGNVNWITDVRPLWAYLHQMKVLILSGDCDSFHSQSNVLNGNLVYLCQSSIDHCGADEDIVECYGIGIVRSVETTSDKIYLLPSISKAELTNVNVIAICNIPLPPALLLNQSSRIGGRISYVYSSKSFAGSKKYVPNSCRPEKHMSNNHIKLV